MKKIGWFKRLFMSYEALKFHFNSQNVTDNSEHDEFVRLKGQYDAVVSASEKLIKEKEERIKLLESSIQSKDFEIDTLRHKTTQLEEKDKQSEKTLQEWREKNVALSNKEIEIKTKIESLQREKESLSQDIFGRLNTLQKIEKTFFGASGNKGKGVLGELQLEALLEKFDLGENFYTKNLMVGSNIVEFAIRSDGEEKKWIPVDSKVLDTDIDSDNQIIMDDAFMKRVEVQVKEIKKYLGKPNTADYGLLVLQNDNIYLEMFRHNPEFFQRMIKEHKVYITSPSSFIQFAWSVSNIIDLFKKVHNESAIYEEIASLLQTVKHIETKLKSTKKEFDLVMERHYPTFENKVMKLEKTLSRNNKELPSVSEEAED